MTNCVLCLLCTDLRWSLEQNREHEKDNIFNKQLVMMSTNLSALFNQNVVTVTDKPESTIGSTDMKH